MIKIPKYLLHILGALFFAALSITTMFGILQQYLYFENVFSEIFFCSLMAMTSFVFSISAYTLKIR